MKAFCHIYAQFDQTGDRIRDETKHLRDLGLVCDTTFGFDQAERNGAVLQQIAAAGGLCAPNVYPTDCDPAQRDSNWWKYSEDECLRLLATARERFTGLGLGPMQAVNTYTPGNAFVAACRRSDIGYILGFCAPIVIEDGGWEIAHYGSPLSPYFISEEDFRKPSVPGAQGRDVLMASMELRNPMVCLDHWSEGPWCPLNALAVDRWLEPGADPLPFLQIAEDWLRQSELSGRLLFFHINLQYFFSGRCYEHNRRALEWLSEQRDKGRLEVGGLKQWRERLRRSEGFERQITYWRGEMMGFHVGHRPGRFPDVVVDESLDHQAVWQRPEALPKRFYNYREKWNYPAFAPDGSAPASSDFDGVELDIAEQVTGELSRELRVCIRNQGAARSVPLLIWDAFKGWEPPFHLANLPESWTYRIIPHPSGSAGALLLEGEAVPGETRLTLSVSGRSLPTRVLEKTWTDLVEAQTFFKGNRPYTVLVAQTPEPFVTLARITKPVQDGEPVIAEQLIGLEHERKSLVGNEFALRFDGTRLICWHRFWGVTAGEIELIEVDETKAGLATRTQSLVAELCPEVCPEQPAYQLFGNIRNPERWDRQLADKAGAKEMRKMNSWFQKQRPGVGEIIVEAHPGVFLPRGSITKVLSHEFSFVKCADGYGLRELCVDYPQGWDWGVAAWVQWRHLRLRLEGLGQKGEQFLLHLHAFDPEERDICQRIHFFNPEKTAIAPLFDEIPIHRNSETCVVKEWSLPKGLEGRWHPSALCSIEVPPECLTWPSLGVWIAPLEKGKLYDWVAERGAPGLLAHLWLTMRKA